MYAQAMALLPYAVLAVPLAVAAFPSLAGAAATDESGRTTVASADVLRRAWLATVVVGLFGAALLVAVAGPVGRFFAMLDAGAAADSSAETLGAMSDAVAAFAPGVLALGVIGLLSRACYVRGHAVAAGGAVALGWVATTALPLAVLDPAGAGGPTTLRVLSIGNSAGLLLGAAVLSLLVVRDWGASALRVPVRPLLAATCGALVAGALGWAVGTRPVALTMVQEVGLGLGVAVGAVAVMSAVALLVDRSLLGRVRGARRAAAVPGAVPGDVTAGGEAP
jgi:putative peptidoglycan lipid II flippase